MRPSSRFQYALKALVDLAFYQATGPVTVRAIAKRQAIPAPSLEQLFNLLRRKGLVVAERGPRGGFRLSRPTDQITVQEIFELLESDGKTPARLRESTSDPAGSIWKQVEKAVRTTLHATTLRALAEQTGDQTVTSIRHHYTFHI